MDSALAKTLNDIKGVLGAVDNVRKSITTATGLTAYDLQAPAKNLYPVNTPLRNSLPRVPGGIGTATNWRAITAITGSGMPFMGWVPEGQRSARMSYTTQNKAASYATLGEEDQASYEAIHAGVGFEDVRAGMTTRLLQKLMQKEEVAILGGNQSLLLGTPATPTLAASGSGATLPTATYSVIVVALTFEGYKNSSLAGGVATSQLITGADGNTYTLSGGSSQKSAAATQAITLGQILSCSTTVIRGAVAYAWYVGTAGSEKLEAITTLNSVTFSAPLAGTGQAATAITADNSRNANYAFDGLLTNAYTPANGAYYKALATGTAGTGTALTSSGRGSVNEIDDMLNTMWNTYQMSPSVIYVNAQEQKNITNKVLNGASAPLLRINTDAKQPYAVVANGVVDYYYSPYANAGNGGQMAIRIHPELPPGTLIGWADNLPSQYINNDVPNVAEIKERVGYYQIDWPLRTRQQEVGVYVEEVLAVYAPFAMAILTNIGNG